MNDPNHDELLKLLQAQGEQFLQKFSLPPSMGKIPIPSASSSKAVQEESEEEWGGIQQSSDSDSEERESGSDFEQEDDDFVAGSSISKAPIVVFAQPGSQTKEKEFTEKALMRSFMSSKISKHRSEGSSSNSKKRAATDEEEDERSNAQNDAMLHKLVHTKLLSGSLDPDLNLTGAERRKALAGRVLELTGSAKMGKGEHIVRSDEHRRASKRVREGISDKKQARQKQELEEAKNLGNYHPALKKLFEASSTGPPKKREHGMKMGVGRFKNGSLILSKTDVQAIQGRPSGHPSSKRRR